MAEAEELYTQQNPNVTFGDTQYEASGTLNEMLGAGQYADILITASKGTMDDAVEAGYVKEDTRQTMFNNDLVIVTKEGGDLAGQDISLEDIAAGKYTLAVGDENVPAGNYACQSLTTVGGYIEPDGATGADATGKGGEFSATLQPKVTLGGKVGDVCKYAESGEVDIAMVYTSDVYRMGGVAICSVVPNDTHKAIADVVTVHDEVIDDSQEYELIDPTFTWKRKKVSNFTAKELLRPIFQGGELVYDLPSIDEIRENCAFHVASLWDEVKRFENPQTYYVDLSQKLWDIKYDLLKSNGR